MKKLTLVLTQEFKAKLLRFLGALILVGKNSKEYTELLKKFQQMPCSRFSGSEEAQSLVSCNYQEEKLFSLYHHARVYGNVPESPVFVSTPANTNRISLRKKSTNLRPQELIPESQDASKSQFDLLNLLAPVDNN